MLYLMDGKMNFALDYFYLAIQTKNNNLSTFINILAAYIKMNEAQSAKEWFEAIPNYYANMYDDEKIDYFRWGSLLYAQIDQAKANEYGQKAQELYQMLDPDKKKLFVNNPPYKLTGFAALTPFYRFLKGLEITVGIGASFSLQFPHPQALETQK